jgi:hypothetical protein
MVLPILIAANVVPTVLAPLSVLVSLILPLSPWLYGAYVRLLKPIELRSMAFEVTSPEAIYERQQKDPKSWDPYYDDRFSRSEAERLLKTVPLEVHNASHESFTARALYLDPDRDYHVPSERTRWFPFLKMAGLYALNPLHNPVMGFRSMDSGFYARLFASSIARIT